MMMKVRALLFGTLGAMAILLISIIFDNAISKRKKSVPDQTDMTYVRKWKEQGKTYGSALYITDNIEISTPWIERLHRTDIVDIRIDKSLEGKTLKQGENHAELTLNSKAAVPDIVLLQVGCNDNPDADTAVANYSSHIFYYPLAYIQNTQGTGRRHKKVAVGIDMKDISNSSFAGPMVKLVSKVRTQWPQALIFIAPPVKETSTAGRNERRKINQIKKIANMLAVPFIDENWEMLADYSFVWNPAPQKPNIGNLLILGDSYSEQGLWTKHLHEFVNTRIVNLAVSSATLKDNFSYIEAPYTSRPDKSDNRGNNNTLACQVEKLIRLMHSNGTAVIPASYSPDYIILQGGINDNPDPTASSQAYSFAVKSDTRTNFAGAIAYLTKRLHSMFPHAQIMVTTPSGLYYGHTSRPFDFILKAEQIRKASSLSNVKTINWDKEGRLTYIFNNPAHTGKGTKASPIIYNKPTAETIDMLHPNESGSKWLAITVAKELIKNKRHK